MSQCRARAGTLAEKNEPGAFPLLKTTEPAPAPLPKNGRILGSSRDLRPQPKCPTPLKKRLAEHRWWANVLAKKNVFGQGNALTSSVKMKKNRIPQAELLLRSHLDEQHLRTHVDAQKKDWKEK